MTAGAALPARHGGAAARRGRRLLAAASALTGLLAGAAIGVYAAAAVLDWADEHAVIYQEHRDER